MANRFCTKCGSAASDGQRFCKVCGQPLPQAAAPELIPDLVPEPTPSATPDASIEGATSVFLMPGPSATSTPAEPAAWSEPPASSSASTPQACAKCQTPLTPGQQTCWVCGHPAGVPAEAAPSEPSEPPSAGWQTVAPPTSEPEPLAPAPSFTAIWTQVAGSAPESAASAPSSETAPSSSPASTGQSSFTPAPVDEMPPPEPVHEQPSAALTCVNCGGELAENQRFCRKCGQPFAGSAAPPPPEPAVLIGEATALWSQVATPEPEPAAQSSASEPEPAAESEMPAPTRAVCSKCQTILTPGQQSCWVCGQPVASDSVPSTASEPETSPSVRPPASDWAEVGAPAAASPIPVSEIPEPESPAAVPELVCSKCSSPLTPGQKFCRICGQPTPPPAEEAAPTPVTAPAELIVPDPLPAPITAMIPDPIHIAATPEMVAPATEPTKCPTCRTTLTPDQRVCWVCGQVLGAIQQPETLAEMGAPTGTYKEVAVAVPEVTGTRPVSAAPVPFPPLPPASTPPPPYTPPQYAPVQPIPTAMPPKKSSNAGLWIVLAVLLLLVGGGGAWLYLHGRSNPVPATDARQASAPDTSSSATPAPAPTPEAQPAQPVAQPPAQSDTSPPSLPAPASPSPATHTSPAKPPAASPVHTPHPSSVATAPTPQFAPQPPSEPKPTSGLLRYSGPPVSQGGVVVFDNLPAGRLKFSYDSNIWHPTIGHNPDGTQKLTLRLAAPGTQTDCVVKWELVP